LKRLKNVIRIRVHESIARCIFENYKRTTSCHTGACNTLKHCFSLCCMPRLPFIRRLHDACRGFFPPLFQVFISLYIVYVTPRDRLPGHFTMFCRGDNHHGSFEWQLKSICSCSGSEGQGRNFRTRGITGAAGWMQQKMKKLSTLFRDLKDRGFSCRCA